MCVCVCVLARAVHVDVSRLKSELQSCDMAAGNEKILC